ncbi:MAG: CPBP family intramembrane glutamic endopeptidase [Oceanicaulis sp.]
MSFTSLIAAEPALGAGLAAVAAAFVFALFEAWRDARRRRAGEEVRSTLTAMAVTIVLLWLLCAACLAAWLASGRSLVELGLGAGEGWRALAAWALGVAGAVYLIATTLLSVSTAERRERLAEQIKAAGGLEYFDLRSPREAGVFQGLAVTAGTAEEIVFRGFVMLTLALVLPFWLAAIAAAMIFIAFHAYQGVAGMIRIVPITLALTVLVVLGGTLWPAILVHIVVDAVGGMMMWGARTELAAHRAATR